MPKKLAAYPAPMLVFVGLLALNGLLKKIDDQFWLSSAEYWIYPLQTIVCGVLLLHFRSAYNLSRPRHPFFALGVAVFVFVVWIAPQAFLGFTPRTDGFNPGVFSDNPLLYLLSIVFRFLRLLVVVPLVEEIFWRGFLLRFLIAEEFDRVAFGTFSWLSFMVVTLAFMFSHSQPDWAAALVAGALYNVVAYRTRSLSACVLAHAVTNLLLGLWIMKTGQWEFW
jgi:uncharacterized protein